MGGMGIRNPVEMANIAHITSVSGKRHISDAIKERKPFSLVDHNVKMTEAISTMHHELQQQDQNKLDSVLSTLDVPVTCDGCGATFSYKHALDCKKGGLVTRRHNEDIILEQVIQEAREVTDEPSLVADLGVRGVWQPQTQALFDIRVIDTDAPSHVNRSVAAILASAELSRKEGKYNNAANARRASITLFVVSVDGALGLEAT
eukprot:Em0020g474a